MSGFHSILIGFSAVMPLAVAAILLAGTLARIPAQSAGGPSVRVRLLDHNYGDFGGEFDSRVPAACGYDIHGFLPGMVADTLGADPATGRRRPSRRGNDHCSANLEKWFDPAVARQAVCEDLPLQPAGTPGRPAFRFDSEAFFPLNARSVQPGLAGNDFSFCMEINAGFFQRGGEVLKFRGDDDLWVFLDGRLAIDRGGVHFPQGDTLSVDSLPGSAGKLGSYRTLDVYYCSRVPNTSVFGMEAPLDPRPLEMRSLRIVDTAGKELASRDVVVGKTKVCAGPEWSLPPASECGNHEAPAAFASARWDLNGRALTGPGGAECVELDPAGFPHGTRVQVTARAGERIARISLILARLAKVKDGYLRGNGRAERIEIPVDSGSGVLAEGLDVEFALAGRQRFALAFPVEGAAAVAGELGSGGQGPVGLSAFPPVEALARQTHFGKTVTQIIRLRDGVGPILTGARVGWNAPGAGSAAAYLEWEASEALSAAAYGRADILGRRHGRPEKGLEAFGLGASTAPEALETGTGRFRFRLPLTAAEAGALRAGDSLSLAPAVRDAEGNHAGRWFVPVLGPPSDGGALGALRLPEAPARGTAFLPAAGLPAVILVTAGGTPVRPGGPDRRVAEAGGPVFLLPARAPLERVELRFFDHLGAAVNEARVEVTPSDWEALRGNASGDTTWVGLRWYPVAASGDRLGTGAYLVKGRAVTRDGALVRGADGEWRRWPAASVRFGPARFGYLRE